MKITLYDGIKTNCCYYHIHCCEANVTEFVSFIILQTLSKSTYRVWNYHKSCQNKMLKSAITMSNMVRKM